VKGIDILGVTVAIDGVVELVTAVVRLVDGVVTKG
jgi:hypothetical protein